MFPISSDGVFEDPCIFFEQDGFLQDLLAGVPILEGNERTETRVKKRPRKAPPSAEVEENKESGGDAKKSAHRFIEKQRRQEMAALYASLRYLLPLEYVKGKRAVSDHMHQAANYIHDMKKKLEEMKLRRDNLRSLSSNIVATSTAIEAGNQNSKAGDSSPYCVEINPYTDGFEILISSSLNKECFPLSMVLADLLERQLSVIDCISSRGDQCYIHKIHIQLNDSTSIDLSELRERLVNFLELA